MAKAIVGRCRCPHGFVVLGTIGLLLGIGSLPVQAADRPLVVGHRGMRREAPENTLANFRACLELKLGIELDVRRSKDGQLIVLHDATLDRTTDGKGKAADLTLAELKKLDAGSWFDPAFRNERLPSLEEVFTLAARYPQVSYRIAIDLKEPGTEADVVRLAKKQGVLNRLLFIGLAITDADVRRQLRRADPRTQVARLAEPASGVEAALRDADVDWVYIRHLPGREEVARVHAAGKRLFLSGPRVAGRETDAWRQAAEAGVDAILTDYPLELASLLRDRPAARGKP